MRIVMNEPNEFEDDVASADALAWSWSPPGSLPDRHDQAVTSLDSLMATLDGLAEDNKRLRRENGILLGERANTAMVPLKSAVPDNISYETVRVWCSEGLVIAKRIGKRWLVDQNSLRARLMTLGYK